MLINTIFINHIDSVNNGIFHLKKQSCEENGSMNRGGCLSFRSWFICMFACIFVALSLLAGCGNCTGILGRQYGPPGPGVRHRPRPVENNDQPQRRRPVIRQTTRFCFFILPREAFDHITRLYHIRNS